MSINVPLDEFRTQGYVHLKNVLSKESVHELFLATADALKTFGGSGVNRNSDFTSWNDPEFSKALIELRKQDPNRFGALYDSMLISYSLQKLCYNNSLGEISAKLLEMAPTSLAFRGPMLRMDVPQDKRNIYGWHQDSSYTPYNTEGRNSIICWAPLVDVSPENGTMQVCPESQAEPTVMPSGEKTDKLYSAQHLVSEDIVKKYKVVDIIANAGDVVFTYSNLVHRSGVNSSEKVRFTAILRFHSMLTEDFYLFPKS